MLESMQMSSKPEINSDSKFLNISPLQDCYLPFKIVVPGAFIAGLESSGELDQVGAFA